MRDLLRDGLQALQRPLTAMKSVSAVALCAAALLGGACVSVRAQLPYGAAAASTSQAMPAAAVQAGLQVPAPTAAQPALPERVGRLAWTEGEVQAWNETRQAWEPALLNVPVTSRSAFWTAAASRAEVTAGSAALRLDALSQANLLRLDDGGTDLDIPRGTVGIRLRAPGDPAWQVAARDAIAALSSPGAYRIEVDAARGTLTVQVTEGAAEVVAGDRRIPVAAGRQLSLDLLTWQVRAQSPASRSAFDDWTDARDREQQRLAAWNYVSPEMTGAESLDAAGRWTTDPTHGAVWYPTTVAPGWAPYRNGRWVWQPPWGWTWVEDAPWGFAPFHYGQWVLLNGLWGWAPGPFVRRPVHLPFRPGAWARPGGPTLPVAGFAAGQGLAPAMPMRPPVAGYPLPRFTSQFATRLPAQSPAQVPVYSNLHNGIPYNGVPHNGNYNGGPHNGNFAAPHGGAYPHSPTGGPGQVLPAPAPTGSGPLPRRFTAPVHGAGPGAAMPPAAHAEPAYHPPALPPARLQAPPSMPAPAPMARYSAPAPGFSHAPAHVQHAGGGSRPGGGGGGGGGRHR